MAGAAMFLVSVDTMGAMPVATRQAEVAQLEEVLVTARRVEERLQDVPAVVTSVSGERLEEVKSLQDIQGLVPGLIFQTFGSTPLVGMRGQGNRLGPNNILGIYEDGVFLAAPMVTLSTSLDVARVEVAKGPQSTLYGRATLAGAINVVSNDPTKDRQNSFEVAGGGSDAGGEQSWRSKLVLSGPLTDSLSGRLVAVRAERDGYVYDPVTKLRAMGYDRKAVKGKLLWEPTAKLAVRLSALWVNDNAPRGETFTTLTLPPLGWNINMADTSAAAKPLVDAARVFGDTVWQSHFVRPQRADIDGLSGTLDVRYQTPIGELAYLGSATHSKVFTTSTVDMTSLGVADVQATTRESRYSHELRLTGKTGRFSYLTGLYYLYASSATGTPDGDIDLSVPSIAFFYGSANYDLPSITAINPAVSRNGQYLPSQTKTRATAVFGQLGYDATDKLNFTIGARNGKDTFYGKTAAYLTTQTGVLTTLLAPFYRSADFTATTGSAVASYKITPDIMTYFSYARGNSPGGLNGGASQAAASTPFDPQDVDAYELGLKSQWFDRRLQVNVALYDSKYKNLQLLQNRAIPVPGGAPGQTILQTVTTNAAESHARGMDLDAQVVLSSHWMLGLGYTYLDSKIDKYNVPAPSAGNLQPLDFTGAQIVRTPENTGNLSATYTTRVGPGDLRLTAEAAFSSWYTNEYVGASPGTAYPGRPGVPAGVTTSQVLWLVPTAGYTTFNLNGSYKFGPWQLTGIVRNVANKQYIASAAANLVFQVPNTVPGEPRTWELGLRRSF